MDTLANILSGVPANPMQGSQGISPQLMQMLMAQQMGKQQLSPDMNMPNGGLPGIGSPNAGSMAGQPGQLMQTPPGMPAAMNSMQPMPGSMGNIALGLAAGKY